MQYSCGINTKISQLWLCRRPYICIVEKLHLKVFLGFLLIWSQSLKAQSQEQQATYANHISTERLREHVFVLSADSMGGREVGTAYNRKAAQYLADQFSSYGIPPCPLPNGDSSYFQPFELEKRTMLHFDLRVGKKGEPIQDQVYYYGYLPDIKESTLPALAIGYGIEEKGYSEYEGVTIKGHPVILFSGSPRLSDSTTSKRLEANWAQDWRKKAELAYTKGAGIVFMVVGQHDSDFVKRFEIMKPHLTRESMSSAGTKAKGLIFISHSQAAQMLGISLQKLEQFKKAPITERAKLHASKSILRLSISSQVERIEASNVLGYIEGTDLKEEIIVLSAHFDHLGMHDNTIYRGADDNGSGTASLLELARVLMEMKQAGFPLRRSILIMPLNAEEKGLLGAAHFVTDPVFPLNRIVTDLNIDMIGRIDDRHSDSNYVYLIGSNRLSDSLHVISEKANQTYTNLSLDYTFNHPQDPNRFYYRSDHYHFAKNNIPVIFYFSGIHVDYHKPGDTPEKLGYQKMTRINQLVFHTLCAIAQRNNRPELTTPK
jgi:hypothetical protein